MWPLLPGTRFLHDRRGVTAIEFAMLAPTFLATLLGGFEASLDYYMRFQLDYAAQYALRQIEIGQAPAGASAFKTLFCAQLPSTMSCDRLRVDVKVVTNFNTVTWIAKNPSGSALGYAPGQPGDVVLLQVLYAAPAIAPIWFTPTDHFSVNGSDQTVRFISMNAVARNEKP